jgi:hypothetical protein
VLGFKGLVERTLVSFPSQLQEALSTSTKVDTEYNLPTRVPKTRVDESKFSITLGLGFQGFRV